MGGGNQRVDGPLVLCLVENLNGSASNIIVLVTNELQHSLDDTGSADLAECIRRAAADPPVTVLQRIEQVLDRLGIADLVENLHGRTPGVLVLILQNLDQITNRVGMVGLDDDINRLVLNVDLRVLEQRTDPLNVDRTVHSLERGKRGTPNEFVRVSQLRLKRGLDFRRIEPREQVDDVDARNRVLTPDASDQLRHRTRVCNLADDPEERRLLVGLLLIRRVQQLAYPEAALLRHDHFENRRFRNARRVQSLNQQVRRIVAITGQGPGN